MTKDDIIRMAREAGFVEYELDDGTTDAFDVRYERFANLVAEREREACAKVAEQFEPDEKTSYVMYASKAIRARGKT